MSIFIQVSRQGIDLNPDLMSFGTAVGTHPGEKTRDAIILRLDIHSTQYFRMPLTSAW